MLSRDMLGEVLPEAARPCGMLSWLFQKLPRGPLLGTRGSASDWWFSWAEPEGAVGETSSVPVNLCLASVPAIGRSEVSILPRDPDVSLPNAPPYLFAHILSERQVVSAKGFPEP